MRSSDWSSDVWSSDLLHALGGSRAQIGVVRHTVAIRILGSFGGAGGLRTQCGDQANLDDGFAEAVGARDITCIEPAIADIGAQAVIAVTAILEEADTGIDERNGRLVGRGLQFTAHATDAHAPLWGEDRKSVVYGKVVSGRVE